MRNKDIAKGKKVDPIKPQQVTPKVNTNPLYAPQTEEKASIEAEPIIQEGFSEFSPHMRFREAKQLKLHDKIDHSDMVGRFVCATIIDREGSNLKIHYDGWDRKWDIWCDFQQELYRFARVGSISKRVAHRFKEIKKGDNIDVNPTHRHLGWKIGEITRLDQKSGQVQIVYDVGGKDYLYWAHLDNEKEIAEFKTNTHGMKLNATKYTINKEVPPFKPHMSLQEAYKLNLTDSVDHRDEKGRFMYAAIYKKQGTNLKIRPFDNWKWDTWSDFTKEIHRFAKAGSI